MTRIPYKPLNEERGEKLLSKYVKILLVVALYWVTSIVTVFVNKALLSNINLDAPLFITWYQCVVSVVICMCLKVLSKFYPHVISFSDGSMLDVDILRKVLPLSVLFTSMIATNNLCLKYVDVSFYYIGRSLTTVFNVVLSYVLLRQKSSRQCIVCCAIIVSGFWLGVDQESISTSFSGLGTLFGVIGSMSLSLYSIYTKKTLPYVNQEVLLMNYYVNLYSCILFIPLMMISGEFVAIAHYPNLFELSFWGFLTIGGICGFAIGYVTGLQIKMTSPLTHNISGTAKACAQTVLATQWYNESKSWLWWLSNFVALLGSALYARVKQLEMERLHNQKNLSQNI